MVESKAPSPSGTFRFGVFQVNLAARELRKHGVRVRLHGQPFCILSLLLEKPGEVVTREAMRQGLWPADTFVDFEHGLNSSMKKLRGALGDSADNPRYIETIPRVGYRFVAPVEQIRTTTPAPESVSVPPLMEPLRQPLPVPKIRRPLWSLLPGFSVILLVVGAYFGWSLTRHRPQSADGLVAGSPAVEKRHAPSAGQPPSPKSAEAHDLYVRGIYFWNKRTTAGLQQAIECFQQATTLDPNYALAYAGLANSYTLFTAYSSASEKLYVPQARAAASRALALDPSLAEAHAAMALIVQNHDWDWETSEKEYRRAIDLNPDYPTAHQWYGEHLMWLGRFDEALAESDKALQLDPLSVIIATDRGAVLFYSRQYDRAIEQFQAVLRKDPHFPRAVGLMIYAYVQEGKFTKALAEIRMRRDVYRDGAYQWMMLGYVSGRAGQMEQAKREFKKLETLDREEPLDPNAMFYVHLALGDKEEALADLERAYSGHFSFLASLKVDPVFDPLRSDPRFQDLLRRVHLAQ